MLGGDHNEAAWRRFLARYESLMDGWCRLAGLQVADANDLKQSVMTGLLTALKQFRYDPASSFRGYLRTCANNALRKFFGERGRKPGNYGTGGDGPRPLDDATAADPDELAALLDDSVSEDLRALHRVVERVRAQVSDDTWQAYRMTAIDGRPAADVAAELGKSVAAVYTAKSRVGKLLREAGGRPLQSGNAPAGCLDET